MIVRSTLCLVFLFPVRGLLYQALHFSPTLFQEWVEFETELAWDRYWVFRAKLPYIVARGNFSMSGDILSTARNSAGEPIMHLNQYSLFLVQTGAPYTNSPQDAHHWLVHCSTMYLKSWLFQQIVYTSGKLAFLFATVSKTYWGSYTLWGVDWHFSSVHITVW